MTPPPPGMAPVPTSFTSGAQPATIVNLRAVYTYLHVALPCAQFVEDAEDSEHDTDFDPDMLTAEG